MELQSLLFDDWNTLLRTLIIGILGYVSLVLLLRISGRRTLSKMNAFDLVVTIALGSTLDGVKAVVLETNGRFSVVTQGDSGRAESLEDVKIPGNWQK